MQFACSQAQNKVMLPHFLCFFSVYNPAHVFYMLFFLREPGDVVCWHTRCKHPSNECAIKIREMLLSAVLIHFVQFPQTEGIVNEIKTHKMLYVADGDVTFFVTRLDKQSWKLSAGYTYSYRKIVFGIVAMWYCGNVACGMLPINVCYLMPHNMQ